MALLENDQLVLVKLETTYGADSTPNNTNAVRLSNCKLNPVLDKADRKNMTGMLGNQGKITVGKRVELSGDVELAGSGMAGVAPYYGVLLEVCAHEKKEIVGVSVIYTAIDAMLKSGTIYWRSNKLQHKMTGVRGSVSFKLNPKEIPMASFKLIGIYNEPTVELAAVTGVDWTVAKTPIGVMNSTTDLILFGGNPRAASLSFDPGVKVEYRNLIGYEGVDLMDRKSEIKLKIEVSDADYVDYLAKANADSFGDFAFQVGAAAGTVVRFEADNIQLSDTPSLSYQDSLAFFDIGAAIVPTERNNDYRIIYS